MVHATQRDFNEATQAICRIGIDLVECPNSQGVKVALFLLIRKLLPIMLSNSSCNLGYPKTEYELVKCTFVIIVIYVILAWSRVFRVCLVELVSDFEIPKSGERSTVYGDLLCPVLP